jgi:predicted nucleotidyltransferase component of viral defense system
VVTNLLAKNKFFSEHDVRFVGGTALSYLIAHRLSEDLDFAILELPVKEIRRTMKQYGAKEIEHNPTLKDYIANDGGNIEDYHVKFMLDSVKVEFFIPPFNILEKQIWQNEGVTFYNNSFVKVASFKTIIYMKIMAFWNRKKYRNLFDILSFLIAILKKDN